VRRFTPQQEAVFAAVRSGTSNVLVRALAGTGKTTTAVQCFSQGVRGKAGFVAFNRHIAEELQQRLPPSAPACTLHALGFVAVQRAFPGVTLDEAKLTKLARAAAPDAFPSVRIAAEHLARLCKYTLADEQDPDDLSRLAEHHGLEVDDRDRDKVFALAAGLVGRSAAWTESVDFDDMVWFPHRHGLRPDQFDLLLVDEAQDLNRAQQALARSATASGRLCPVGDPNQAIYGFTGADCEALLTLGRELSAEEFPLTVTWRCPASHVGLARKIVPELEAAPDAADGLVETLPEGRIAAGVRPGDLVICRKNAPLVGLTYRLVLAGVPAMMRGREIGRGLLALIRRLKPDNLEELIDKLEDYREREARRLGRKHAPSSQFDALEDRCDCLGKLAAQVTSLDQLATFIESKFDDNADPAGQVVLSSVHRAKGLEADTVFVLDPASLPLARRDSKPWEQTQERNICYIAATRSKRRLVFEDSIPNIYL
jgi:DNA helicase-2/ATP-dependent DNA helicase PcrA